MQKKLKVLSSYILFVLILAFLFKGLQLNPTVVPSPMIGKSAPSFSGSNQLFQGRVTLFHVFASWCLYCRAEHPILMDITEKQVVNMVGLDYKDDSYQAKEMLVKYGNPYSKVIADPKGRLAIAFGVYGTPETFVIDKKGVIRYRLVGPITVNNWKTHLFPLVKKLQKEDA